MVQANMYTSVTLCLFFVALRWFVCPAVEAQLYPTCPQSNIEHDRTSIGLTSNKFIRVLEKFQNKPAEIVFVLDSSGSVGESNFGCEVQFVRHFSKLFSISEETSRLAVVTYSSCGKIYTDLDYINSPVGKNKCTLLGTDLPRTYYRDGGTCTAGGLRRAQDILAGSRPTAEKIIFVLTDGQSNDGGSPLQVAADLRATATVFAIGLGEGISETELNGIATSPSEDYVFLLSLLTDVEGLALKVVRDQTDMASWDRNVASDLCNSLCISGSNCCDLRAICSCATQTGSYGCACHPGYTGDGTENQCSACPPGTYKEQYGNQGCMPCPALSTTGAEAATSIGACKCQPGYEGSPETNAPCRPISCDPLSFASTSGVVVIPPNCGNLFGTECRMQCLPNYRSQPGTADTVTCLATGQWSHANPLQCIRIICEPLPDPTNGQQSCDTTDWRIGTVCNLTCSQGYEREGDLQRRCELNQEQQIGEWSNDAGKCKAKTCPALLSNQYMKIRPATCDKKVQDYNSDCYYECDPGFRLQGVNLRACQADGTWSDSSVMNSCIDIEPPEFITCPSDISLVADRNKNFATTSLVQPMARDNAGTPLVTPSLSASQEQFFLNEETVITYTARDGVGLEDNCTFRVTVEDEEPPRVTYCPANIEAESGEREHSVNWTVPTFKDNSEMPVKITNNRPPGSEFSWGLPELVWYQAQDQAGNVAFCNFTVAVRQYPCPFYPPPLNGALACEKWLGGQFCRVSCKRNFDFNRKPMEEYFCFTPHGTAESVWGPSFTGVDPASFRIPWPDCTEMKDPKAETTLGFEFFVGDCELDENATATIAADFVARFQEINNIVPGFCQADTGCSVENVEVSCGNTTARRRRRASDSVLQIQFTVVVDTAQIQTQNEALAADPSSNALLVIDDLMNTMNTVVTMGLLNISTADGNVLTPRGPVTTLHPITLLCSDGEVLQNQSCLACPPGTYHDVEGGFCQDCSIGFYQYAEGQLSCLPCPLGTTTRRANSKDLQDCKAPCPKGSYSASGLETCIACMRGTYQPFMGALSCLACPHGLTTWTEGALSEDECTDECPMGKYSGTGFAPCSPCSKGTYQPLRTQTSCVPCPEGLYTHDEGAHALGYCQVINECESEPCQHRAVCVDLPRGYRCLCPAGFTGSDCQTNIDDCDHDLCLNNGTCVDMVARYRCQCPEGFEGEHCQIDLDECKSNPCHNRAVCTDGPNSYTCACAPGFTGDFCEVNLFDCASDPCQNEGTCVDLAQNFTCCCRPGYRGRHCEIVVDHCQSAPCMNNATCVASFNSAMCQCLPGFKGERCEVELNECELQQVVCQHGGTCVDVVNGFRCNCPPGYSGTNCNTALSGDFDLLFPEARTSDYAILRGTMPGLNALTATFWMRTTDQENAGTPLSYATRDANGVVQDNAFTLSDYNSFAIIVNGEFMYTDEKVNSDSNWHHVAITWASLDGQWAIYVDGMVRQSGAGFQTGAFIQGSGVMILGQEQDSYAGSFAQTQAFIGDLSQLNIWDYAMTPDEITAVYSSCAASGNALAWSQVASSIRGDVILIQSSQLCSSVTDCQPSTCQSGGTCTDLVGSFNCECGVGYHGTNCELMRTSCMPGTCLNGGSCHSNGSSISCTCALGYLGERCELSDPCRSVTCLNVGVCLNDGSRPKCNCTSGYTGRVCEYDINECDSENGGCEGTCQNTAGSFICGCASGYALQPDGQSCKDISYCTHEGRFHYADDVWDYKCSECRCVKGAAVCEVKACADIQCKQDEYKYHAPGACCPQCLPASKTCSITRDGKHNTYDFNRYEHRGNCRYVLSQDCVGSEFTVEVQYEATKKKIKKWALWLRLDCVEVEIDFDGTVKVTGVPVELPYLHAEPRNVMITHTNTSANNGDITIQTNRGVVVNWSRFGAIEVSAPGTFRGQLCGLCGNMNGNRKDDRTTRQFLPARSAREFAHSWKVDGYRFCAIPKARNVGRLAFGAISNDKIAACSELSFGFLRDVRKKCSVFRQRSFQMCHSVVNPTRYIEWCMQDACTCHSNEPCHCESIAAYMYECQRNHASITWTSDNPCNIRCPARMIYDHCGPACLPTCENPNPDGPMCRTRSCTPQCHCPAGSVHHDSSCILPRYCPAVSGN